MRISFILIIAIIISNQVNYIKYLELFFLAYMLVSLIFSASIFMLFLRHYKITSSNDILIRFIAIIGAIFCLGIWGVLIYPVTLLLQ